MSRPFARSLAMHAAIMRIIATGTLANAKIRSRSASRYDPHQGKQERARRLRTKLEPKPRRMWQICYPPLGVAYEMLIKASTRRPAIQLARRIRQDGFYCPSPVLGVLHG